MILLETATATTLATSAPATFTCATCPFARNIDGDRYCCTVSETASDVTRGHWESKASCHEAIAQAEAEKAAQAPIAQTEAPAPATPKSATPSTTAPATLSGEKPAPAPTPAAIGENDDSPPNRGDNGRGRVQPIATKKLLPLIVPISRIRSDIPASNFDPNELEILGELMLSIGGFVVPPVLVRDSGGYRVVSGHLQFHAAVLAKQLNPRAGETIPAIVLEPENQATALAQLKRLKFAA